MVNLEIKQEYITREKNRVLLIVYDFLLFAFSFVIVFLVPVSIRKELVKFSISDYLIHFVLAYGCLLISRLVFKCYKQIIRYGNMRAFIRIFIAELLGLTAYTVISQILPIRHAYVLRTGFLFLMDYSMVITARIIYFYLFLQALQDTTGGKIIRKILEVIGGVDIESKRIGATYSISHLFGRDADTVQSVPVNDIIKVVNQFSIHGEVVKIDPITKGYINRTYKIETQDQNGVRHKYTLQRINTDVFKDPDILMDNYVKVTTHLQKNFLLEGHTDKGSNQTVKPVVTTGKAYLRNDTGCWRMTNYFDNVHSMDIPDSPETFYKAGQSFGAFLKAMSDVPIFDIKDTIQNFHNTKLRYLDLLDAIKNDPVKRVKKVTDEIKFVMDRAERYGLISEALESGRIPYRITHNDCNLNNILFDNKTNKPVAIIDLDTVMAGSPLYDYGDSMRIGTNTAVDDEQDLSKVSCDLKLYEAYARGYLESCGDILTEEELKLLPYAAIIITSEDGIRFLMDYINGDTYYNIFYPGQNLDRCRTQLALIADMEKKLPEIKEILRNIYTELGLNAEIEKEDAVGF